MASHCRHGNERTANQHPAGGHVTNTRHPRDGRAVIRVEIPQSTQRRHGSAEMQDRDVTRSPVSLRVALTRQPEVYDEVDSP